MKKRELTQRQKEILDFLGGFIGQRGYPPSLREICARFGIKSPKNAAKHLSALEKKGFITRSANISRAISIPEAPVKGGRTIAIPVAGRVRAGTPHLAVEDILGSVELDAGFFKCGGSFLLKVEGESMINAGIEDGDYVLVRPGIQALNNDIVVAMIDGEATVKRFLRRGDSVILKPENPAMEPVAVKEGSEVSIVGKVISIIKRMEKQG